MRADAQVDGRITYDLDEFCDAHGHPAGRLFTLEVTQNAITYVYADVMATVCGDEVVFDLTGDDLVATRKAN